MVLKIVSCLICDGEDLDVDVDVGCWDGLVRKLVFWFWLVVVCWWYCGRCGGVMEVVLKEEFGFDFN